MGSGYLTTNPRQVVAHPRYAKACRSTGRAAYRWLRHRTMAGMTELWMRTAGKRLRVRCFDVPAPVAGRPIQAEGASVMVGTYASQRCIERTDIAWR
jgi:hypothetical protein